MQVRYLEIVTTEVDACVPRTPPRSDRSSARRTPDSATRARRRCRGRRSSGCARPYAIEEPVVAYWLVDDIEAAVAAAVKAGGVVAHPPMEIPGHGTFAIYIDGGVHHGLWQR